MQPNLEAEAKMLAWAARQAQQRNCNPFCSCPECISDEIDVAAARWSLDVGSIRRAGAEARRVVRARSGGGSGSGSGQRRRKPVRLPSDKQLDFIASLFGQRDLGSPEAALVLAEQTYRDDFGSKEASALIDVLMALPRKQAPAQARVEAELLPDRLYSHPTRLDRRGLPEVYRVQRSKSSGYLFAVRLRSDGSGEYRPGSVRELDPTRLLSLEEAQTWGRATGVCCHCRRQLTNPESIAAGIGPICRAKGWS